MSKRVCPGNCEHMCDRCGKHSMPDAWGCLSCGYGSVPERTPEPPAVDVAKLRELEQSWLNQAESLKFYVGEQGRVSALRHCASELATLLPPEEGKP